MRYCSVYADSPTATLVTSAKEINVIETREPTPLETKQPEALLDLAELYWLQPNPVRRAHAQKLRALSAETKRELKYLDMAVIERTVGLEDSTDEWVEWYEDAQDLTDEEIQERIDYNRQRMVDIFAHKSLATRARNDLFHFAKRAQQG